MEDRSQRKQNVAFRKVTKSFSRRLAIPIVTGLAAAVGLMWLLIWMASEVFEGETAAFDETVRQAIHGLASPELTSIMIGFSFVGSPALLVGLGIVTLAVFIYVGWKRAAILLLTTMAGTVILDLVLKGVYVRVRPEPFFDYQVPNSFSFPSGHALGSFCFFGITAWLIAARIDNAWASWTIRIIASLIILLIGLSRIYLGVHYPTDVVAGFIAGSVWMLTVGLGDHFFALVEEKIPAGRIF